jgi:hypothetical protein
MTWSLESLPLSLTTDERQKLLGLSVLRILAGTPSGEAEVRRPNLLANLFMCLQWCLNAVSHEIDLQAHEEAHEK